MPRTATDAIVSALQSSILRPAIFCEMLFRDGWVYMWTGLGSIDWDGKTWLGIGSLASVSPIEEGSTLEARGITLGLSGIDLDLLAKILGEYGTRLPVTLYLMLFDGSGSFIPNPITAWSGMMDQPTISVDGSSASISIACENKLAEMNMAMDRRYTNEDQQIDHPGDRGFEFVNLIQQVQINWGRVPSSKTNL